MLGTHFGFGVAECSGIQMDWLVVDWWQFYARVMVKMLGICETCGCNGKSCSNGWGLGLFPNYGGSASGKKVNRLFFCSSG